MMVDNLISSDKTQHYNAAYDRSAPIHEQSHTEDHLKCSTGLLVRGGRSCFVVCLFSFRFSRQDFSV